MGLLITQFSQWIMLALSIVIGLDVVMCATATSGVLRSLALHCREHPDTAIEIREVVFGDGIETIRREERERIRTRVSLEN